MKKWNEPKEEPFGFMRMHARPNKISLKSLEGQFYCDFSPCVNDCEACPWSDFPKEINWN